jgi:hypothetical protein
MLYQEGCIIAKYDSPKILAGRWDFDTSASQIKDAKFQAGTPVVLSYYITFFSRPLLLDGR